MKPTAFFLLTVLPSLFPGFVGADDDLSKLAATKRAAALMMSVKVDADQMAGFGAFISDDGLALVDLGFLARKEKPAVVAADGSPLRLGTILGIFLEQRLALMKFDHRPKVWLRLAPKEPEVGETIALIPFNSDDPLDGKISPLVGSVIAKRSDISVGYSPLRFTKVMSIGASVSRGQQALLGAGTFAVDRRGDLVAFFFGIDSNRVQSLVAVAPVVALAEQVGKLATGGEPVPHPLPEASNPLDPFLRDADYHKMGRAADSGDRALATRLMKGLLERYPKSVGLKKTLSSYPDPFRPVFGLRDCPEPNPDDPPALQVTWLRLRGATPHPLPRTEFERGARDLQKAVDLSPEDYPRARYELAHLYVTMGRLDDAELLFRKAYQSNPENIYYVDIFASVLFRQGKLDEAKKLSKWVTDLRGIYGWR